MKQRIIQIIAFIAAFGLLGTTIVLMSIRTPQSAAICYPIMAVCGIVLACLRTIEFYQKKKAGEDTALPA